MVYKEKALKKVIERIEKEGHGIYHMVTAHDDWCEFWKGKECNCEPEIKWVI